MCQQFSQCIILFYVNKQALTNNKKKLQTNKNPFNYTFPQQQQNYTNKNVSFYALFISVYLQDNGGKENESHHLSNSIKKVPTDSYRISFRSNVIFLQLGLKKKRKIFKFPIFINFLL